MTRAPPLLTSPSSCRSCRPRRGRRLAPPPVTLPGEPRRPPAGGPLDLARRGAAGPPADAVAARHGARRSARAPTSSRGARAGARPRAAHPRACCSSPSPTGSPAGCRRRRPTARRPRRLARRDRRPGPGPAAGHRTSPLLALIDTPADVNHPEFAGGSITTLGGFPLECAHGTETAAVAAAPKNGVGILGVWPGMRALNVGLPNEIRCANSVAGIARAIEQGAAVINMSYGATEPLLRRVLQLQIATVAGHHAGGRRRQRARRRQPAAVPRLAPPRAHRRRRRQRPQAAVLLERQLRRRPLGAGRRDPHRHPGAVRRGRHPRRLRGGHRHELLGADGRRRRGLGARGQARLQVDQISSVLRNSARDLERRGWDSATGYGMLNVLGALSAPAPAIDPHEPNDDMPWINGRARAASTAPIWRRGSARSCARSSTSTRTPPTSTGSSSPAGARARDAQAALRRRRPRGLHPQRHLDRRRRAADRPLAPQRRRTDTLLLRNPSKRSRVGLRRGVHRRGPRARSTRATTSACGASSAERDEHGARRRRVVVLRRSARNLARRAYLHRLDLDGRQRVGRALHPGGPAVYKRVIFKGLGRTITTTHH